MVELNEKAFEQDRARLIHILVVHFDMFRAKAEEVADIFLHDKTLPAPDDWLGGAEENRIDELRLTAFRTNAESDREEYFDAASKWFQDRHYRRMEAATALQSKDEQIERLTRERDEARGIVRETHWMAVRYADGRKSYAPSMCNNALRKAYDAGWLFYQGDMKHDFDPQYARDGDKAEYRNIEARAEAAEQQVQKLTAENERLRVALMAAREVLQEDRDELFDSVTVAGIAATMDEIDRPHVDRMEAILSSIDAALETQEGRE